MKGRMSLVSFIEEVKLELLQESKTEPFFELDEVTLEVSFVLDATAKAGVKLYVVDVGGETKAQQTHKVSLKLFPLGVPNTKLTGSQVIKNKQPKKKPLRTRRRVYKR